MGEGSGVRAQWISRVLFEKWVVVSRAGRGSGGGVKKNSKKSAIKTYILTGTSNQGNLFYYIIPGEYYAPYTG